MRAFEIVTIGIVHFYGQNCAQTIAKQLLQRLTMGISGEIQQGLLTETFNLMFSVNLSANGGVGTTIAMFHALAE